MTKPVVIVTGVARGLGRAMATGLAGSGFQVVGVFRRRGSGEAPPEEIKLPAERFYRVDADVTNPADCERVAMAAKERFGSIGVLVNNAAVAHDPFPKVHRTELRDIEPEDWQRVFAVNVDGAFLMTRAVLPTLLEAGWGRVINISASMTGMLISSYLPYGPSKAALEAMSYNWAKRLEGSGVTVNELLPGGPTGNPPPPHESWPPGATKWPPAMMLPPLAWLASTASDGVSGRRFIATLWKQATEGGDQAGLAGFPLGWQMGSEEAIVWPPDQEAIKSC